MSTLEIKNLSHNFGDKRLFNKANLKIYPTDKAGITGLNGVGKTTLINILIGNVLPDEGQVKWNPKIEIGYLDQKVTIDNSLSVFDYLKSAFTELYAVEEQVNQIGKDLETEADVDQQEKLVNRLYSLQEELERKDFYSLESNIQKVASGLGILVFGLDTPIKNLSGGQRAKVILAKLLLQAPNLLLLDEPTNFLDTTHIEWLIKYLNGFKGAFLIVSHDYNFLNSVVNCVCDIEFSTITKYRGNCDSFKQQKEERQLQYQKDYASQQKEIGQLEDYVRRNIARASTSKMAKSRQKKLNKIEVMDRPIKVIKPTFSFKYKSVGSDIMLKVNDLAIGYNFPIIEHLNMEVKNGDKISITGFNGIGKTTFLKTICSIIPPLSGNFTYGEKATVGYYEQENIWRNPEWTAIEEIREDFPKLSDKEIRTALASCALKNELTMKPIKTLSGGEQAKIKLCKLTMVPYSMIILDEPTNHLDVTTINHLKKAIREFEGTILFVTHDKLFPIEVTDDEYDFEKIIYDK